MTQQRCNSKVNPVPTKTSNEKVLVKIPTQEKSGEFTLATSAGRVLEPDPFQQTQPDRRWDLLQGAELRFVQVLAEALGLRITQTPLNQFR
jgi:hypothetical protein